MAVDFHARRILLPAPGHHLTVMGWIIGDVAVLVNELILCKDGPYTLAPATSRFQIGGDRWCFHKIPNSSTSVPSVPAGRPVCKTKRLEIHVALPKAHSGSRRPLCNRRE